MCVQVVPCSQSDGVCMRILGLKIQQFVESTIFGIFNCTCSQEEMWPGDPKFLCVETD